MNEEKQIVRDEGLRLKPYMDCCGKPWRECVCVKKGKLSIGVGRNLDDVGISQDEARYLFRNDLVKARGFILNALPWVEFLSSPRRAVFVNMAFNLGARLLGFVKMIAAAEAGNWKAARAHLMDSKYAGQVGDRAERLGKQLETSEWQ